MYKLIGGDKEDHEKIYQLIKKYCFGEENKKTPSELFDNLDDSEKNLFSKKQFSSLFDNLWDCVQDIFIKNKTGEVITPLNI